jgi:hypothetical protein
MNDIAMRLFAFLTLAGFLGILVLHVPRIDITLLVLGTLACAGYDFFFAHRR